jgi:hypothetical protein
MQKISSLLHLWVFAYHAKNSDIKNRFLSYSGLSSLPSYSQVSSNSDWMNWWETNIMAQAGRVDGFPHIGGRAVDVSVRSLNNQQKEALAQILRAKNVEIIDLFSNPVGY